MSYYLMHRGWMDSAFLSREPYTDRCAWVWFIENANFEDCLMRNSKGKQVLVKRGQVYVSIRELAEKFKWSTGRVSRLLDRFTEWGSIVVESGTGKNLITICNYNIYQFTRNTHGDTREDTRGYGLRNDIIDKELKELKEDNKYNNKEGSMKKESFKIPQWVPENEWNDFVEMRIKIKKPLTDKAKKLAIKNLEDLKNEGHPPIDVLNQSVLNSYQGLFAIKNKNNAKKENSSPAKQENVIEDDDLNPLIFNGHVGKLRKNEYLELKNMSSLQKDADFYKYLSDRDDYFHQQVPAWKWNDFFESTKKDIEKRMPA